ncbi:MAG: hypothetical protein HYZ75_16205 [Elusimicrobia bacterium]|nr:hypothetical protein [Elusimicrobiota bacterium]
MERSSIESIVRGLNEAGVRYLIVGGLAVVAHGYLRFTADLDLVLDMESENLLKGLAVLKALGYRPRAPVPIEDFADGSKRRSWTEEKNLKVFSLYSQQHQATEVDVFVEAPFDFSLAYPEALSQPVAEGVNALFVDYARLVELKRKAGRPRDLDDLSRLRALKGEGL